MKSNFFDRVNPFGKKDKGDSTEALSKSDGEDTAIPTDADRKETNSFSESEEQAIQDPSRLTDREADRNGHFQAGLYFRRLTGRSLKTSVTQTK